jgi:hypothetical protein
VVREQPVERVLRAIDDRAYGNTGTSGTLYLANGGGQAVHFLHVAAVQTQELTLDFGLHLFNQFTKENPKIKDDPM